MVVFIEEHRTKGKIMARTLKVYGFTSNHPGVSNGNGSNQTRDIVAAHSVAELLRIANIPRSAYNWSGAETGNVDEVALAMSKPGVLFYKPINGSNDEYMEAI